MGFLNKIFGDPNERVVEGLRPLVEEINGLEPKYQNLSDEQLKEQTRGLRERLAEGQTLDDILPEAFALVREAAKRTLGQRHFDVQLLGGMVLHRGQIAEMRTGEGKTLTSTLAVCLNALEGKGVHVITVNDYLARRDAVWMGQVYDLLGLSVGCINHESSFVYDPSFQLASAEKKWDKERDERRDELGNFKVEQSYLRPMTRNEAYLADITYGTNNEFGFDYLRDNMAGHLSQMVQRELNYAIIDEVDSILIDEARTPLIISAPAEESTEKYYKFANLVTHLKEGDDFNIDEKMRAATYNEGGQNRVSGLLGYDPWQESRLDDIHHLEEALRASTLFKRDRDYVVQEGEVVIVDEFTGRLMFGRRYSGGLHQAIEAKEKVEIQKESVTLATVTFQNYFRLYKKLAGMTGTAATEAEEFSKIYKLETVVMPTNKPMVRKDLTDRIYKNEEGKFQAIVREIKERNDKGQPVLVGTISIERNEYLAELLAREGVSHQILNAKNHEKEAQIIAQAGRRGAVTVATNMAGRGVDIILGGNPPDADEAEKVRQLGGLHVLGTERHESRRIDNQLRGRSGRQGDPGSSQFYVSLEDDLMRIFGSDRIKSLMTTLGVPDDMPLENGMISRSLEAAQKKVEGHNFDIRKHLVEYDDVINKHREVIYKKRREVLEKENIREMILEMVDKEIEQVVLFHTADENESNWNIGEIYEATGTIFPLETADRIALSGIQSGAGDKAEDAAARTKIIDYLSGLASKAYVGLEERVGNPELMRRIEKATVLRTIDNLWIEHLENIDSLRAGIGLRGYGQRDPLIEYKKEAYQMFAELMNAVNTQVVYSIYKMGMARDVAVRTAQPKEIRLSAPAKTMSKGGGQFAGEGDPAQAPVPAAAKSGPKVGRNDPCPCGAKKENGEPVKYKNCHGK